MQLHWQSFFGTVGIERTYRCLSLNVVKSIPKLMKRPIASSFADYSDPNDPALFASMTEERLSGLAMTLVHRNTTHIPSVEDIYHENLTGDKLNNRSIEAH